MMHTSLHRAYKISDESYHPRMLHSECRYFPLSSLIFSLIFGNAITNIGHCEINSEYSMTGPQYTSSLSRSCECCARSMDDNANIHNEKRLIPKYVWRTKIISRHNHIRIMHTHHANVYSSAFECVGAHTLTHTHNTYAYTHMCVHAHWHMQHPR